MPTLILLFLSIFLSVAPLTSAEVTYTFNSKEFGDALVAYAHAKWISYHYHMPLLYKEFPHSEKLMMHLKELHYTPRGPNILIKQLGKRKTIPKDQSKNILYVVPYFPENEHEHRVLRHTQNDDWSFFHVNWDDTGFKQELLKMINPIAPVSSLTLPKGRVAVAIHSQKSDRFDLENHSLSNPLKFPTASYYIEQIRNISLLLHNVPLYVYVFTDDHNPEALLEEFKTHLYDMDIVWECRRDKVYYEDTLIEDFFRILQFDCLIHSESNFSIMASKLGNHKIIISPAQYIKKDGISSISRTNVYMQQPH